MTQTGGGEIANIFKTLQEKREHLVGPIYL